MTLNIVNEIMANIKEHEKKGKSIKKIKLIKVVDINEVHCEICHNPIIYSEVGIVCCECSNKEFNRGEESQKQKFDKRCDECATGNYIKEDLLQFQNQKIIEEIEKMIKEQEEEFERCKELRTTRMKNVNSKNCGMVDAEVRIEHYNEVKLRLEKDYGN